MTRVKTVAPRDRRASGLENGERATASGVCDARLSRSPQIQGVIRPHAIIILPNSSGMEVLVCYEDEGVYIDTYGRITKETVLQWGEMPASVGACP